MHPRRFGRGAEQRPGHLRSRKGLIGTDVERFVAVVVAQADPHPDQERAEVLRRRDLGPVPQMQGVGARREIAHAKRQDERAMDLACRHRVGRTERAGVVGLHPPRGHAHVRVTEEAVGGGQIRELQLRILFERQPERTEQRPREQLAALEPVGLERVGAVLRRLAIAHPVVRRADEIDRRVRPQRVRDVGPLDPALRRGTVGVRCGAAGAPGRRAGAAFAAGDLGAGHGRRGLRKQQAR